MLSTDAWDVIKRNRLIPRRVSKAVLNAISGNQGELPPGLSDYLSQAEFNSLKRDYFEMRANLEAKMEQSVPRNLPFYMLIRNRIPQFEWSYREPGIGLNRYVVTLKRPLVEGLPPSLLSLLLSRVRHHDQTWLHAKYRSVATLPDEAVKVLADLLEIQKFASLDERAMVRLVDWIQRGSEGAPLTMITPICPDYEAQKIGPNLYRYTFARLGSGIGVVGRRYLQSIPSIARAFGQIGLKVRIIVAIGDFEGFSKENCQRLGVSQDQFMTCLAKSQETLRAELSIPVETPLFTDLCDGREKWDEIYTASLSALLEGERGETGLTEPEIAAIAAARAPLYRRWMNGGDFDAVQRLISQGAEYATMGKIAHDFLENPLVLGADHYKMAPFFQFWGAIPMIYLRPNYADIGS